MNAPLIGRAHEKREMLAALDHALAGRGRLMVLEGEAGIGKTRLADEIGAIAAERGCAVCWGRCLEDGSAPPFWPWTQVLRACLRDGDMSSPGIADRDYLARLLPDATSDRAADWHPSALPSSASGSSDAESERFRLFDAVATFLKSCAASKPLVVVLDDLHAADEESILLLGFLVRDLRQAGILVVATYRDSELQQKPRVAQLLGNLSREGEAILLHGLSLPDLREFVQLQTGLRPDPALIDELYGVTEGNPFFVTEVLRLLIAEGNLAGGARIDRVKIPHGVRATIGRRVARLSPTAQQVAQIASIIGRDFDWPLLRSIAGLDEAQLLSALEELISLKLVSRGTSPLHYRFSHALITETLEDSIAPSLRRQLHLRIADEIERGDLTHSMLAQIAHHCLQALPMGDADRAGLCAMRAADAAMTALAYEQAARLYKTALVTLDAHGAEFERRHLELLLKLGDAEGRARNFHDSRETFRQAAETSRRNGSAEGFARSVLGYGMMGADPGRTDQQLVALINEGLRMAGSSRPVLRATLLARLAEEVRWTAPVGETQRIIDEAVSIARDYADPQTLVEALYIKFLIIRGPATAEERLSLSTEMLRMVTQHQLSGLDFNLRYHRGAVLLELGDISAVDREIREMNRLAEGILHQHLGFPELIDSLRSLMEGRIDDAERLALQALEIGRRRPNSVADQIFVLQSLLIKREAGVLAEGVALLERVIAQHPENLAMRCLLGFCYAETDRRSLAKAEFESLAAENFTQVPLDFRWLLSISFLAEICSYLDDKPRATVLYDLLLPYASRSASIGLFGYAGSVSYYLAMLASTLEKFDAAENHFREAFEFETRMIARPSAARTRYRYAMMLAGRNDPHAQQRALEMVHDALSIAETFQLPDLLARSRLLEASLRSSTSASPAAPDRTVVSGRSLSFRKEGEFWVIGARDKLFRLRDSKGLGYIAQLLRRPGAEFHSLNLIADVTLQSDDPDSSDSAARKLGGERLSDIKLRAGFPDHAGEMLDPQAKAAYKRRLVELKEELEDAREDSRLGRAEELEEEIEALHQELRRAIGLGGRDRHAGSASERARIAVSRAIKSALGKITQQNAELGLLLRGSIRTGTFCSFVVGAESAQTSWDL